MNHLLAPDHLCRDLCFHSSWLGSTFQVLSSWALSLSAERPWGQPEKQKCHHCLFWQTTPWLDSPMRNKLDLFHIHDCKSEIFFFNRINTRKLISQLEDTKCYIHPLKKGCVCFVFLLLHGDFSSVLITHSLFTHSSSILQLFDELVTLLPSNEFLIGYTMTVLRPHRKMSHENKWRGEEV